MALEKKICLCNDADQWLKIWTDTSNFDCFGAFPTKRSPQIEQDLGSGEGADDDPPDDGPPDDAIVDDDDQVIWFPMLSCKTPNLTCPDHICHCPECPGAIMQIINGSSYMSVKSVSV